MKALCTPVAGEDVLCSAVPHGSIPHGSVLSQLEKDPSETQLHQHSCATANYFSVKWCLIMGNQLFSAEAFLLGKVGGIPCLRALSAVCAQAMGGCWGFTDRLHWSHEPSKHKEIIHQMWSKRPAAYVSTPFGILCLPKQHGLNRMGP